MSCVCRCVFSVDATYRVVRNVVSCRADMSPTRHRTLNTRRLTRAYGVSLLTSAACFYMYAPAKSESGTHSTSSYRFKRLNTYVIFVKLTDVSAVNTILF